MRREFGKISVWLLAALFLLPMASCGRREKLPVEVTVLPTATPGMADAASPAPTVSFFPDGITDITYYTLSEELETVEVTSPLNGDGQMTPKELVDFVTATMDDVSVTVQVDSVTIEDTSIVVDFKGESVPVRYANTRLESAILDALAQSLLDNYPEYAGVIFRAGGQAYQSENRSFDLNYIYMGR